MQGALLENAERYNLSVAEWLSGVVKDAYFEEREPMNENMTIKDIRTEIDALVAEMLDKGVIKPDAELEIHQDRVYVWLKSSYEQKPFEGDRIKLCHTFEEAHEYIARLPSPEDMVTKEYLTRVASAVDYATENAIADEYVAPLRNVTCAMTENREPFDAGGGPMTANDKASWLGVVWGALELHREFTIPEGVDPDYDEDWADICTAMAWISEELGVTHEEVTE